MDEIHSGRSNFNEPFSLDNQYFDPLECSLLIDELHKLFQYIDQNGKGFLEVKEVIDF